VSTLFFDFLAMLQWSTNYFVFIKSNFIHREFDSVIKTRKSTQSEVRYCTIFVSRSNVGHAV